MTDELNDKQDTPPEETAPAPPPKKKKRRWWKRLLLGTGVGLLAVIALAVLAQWLGYVDRYVEGRIKRRLAQFGVRIEMGSFATSFGPRFEVKDCQLYNLETGEQLAKINRIRGRVRFTDLLALRFSRKMDLEEMELDGLEAWVLFDKEGTSNFRYLREGPPTPRLNFDFSAGQINLKNGVVHYGDQRYEISGNANHVAAQFQPADRALPPEKRTFNVNLASDGANFAYNDKRVDNISLRARARVSRERAYIDELVVRSPLSETRLRGEISDLQKLTYRLDLDSTVDLRQAAETLQTGVALRGNGNLEGTVTGEKDKYQVDANFNADALAADEIRLKALSVTAKGGGENQTYDIAGRAVAELLTAGEFQLDEMQLAGKVVGTGADFRWIGDLQAAAARYGDQATIADLIVKDASAEVKDKELAARVGEARAAKILAEQAQLESFRASGVSVVRTLQGAIEATVDGASVGNVTAQGARVRGVRLGRATVKKQGDRIEAVAQSVAADDVEAQGARFKNLNADAMNVEVAGGQTNVTTGRVTLAGGEAQGAVLGSMNIAGVRLTVRDGRVAGEAGDVAVSDVKLASTKDLPGGGRLENVRAARPVFTLEPAGRYRASFDLSLGGGVLGSIKLGAARAQVTATNTEVQANNFTAEVLQGRTEGDATINLAGGQSHVQAAFDGLDVSGLLAVVSSQANAVLAGRASGRADVTFPGTDAKNASGAIEAKFTGETGGKSNRVPLNGDLLVKAERGDFNLERAEFRTPASAITASGRVSLAKNTGDLRVGLSSADAQELQTLALTSGLLPEEAQKQVDKYGEKYTLGGDLAFNGMVRGDLSNPVIDGRAFVGAVLVAVEQNGVATEQKNAGSLAATLHVAPDVVRVTDGAFRDPGGGTIAFSVTAPRPAKDDIAVEATLNDVAGANLALLSPAELPFVTDAKLSGRVNVTGLPNNMNGRAEFTGGAGDFRTATSAQQFDGLTIKANFNGKLVNLEQADVALPFGKIASNGQVDITDLKRPVIAIQAGSDEINLAKLAELSPTKPGATPLKLEGLARVRATLRGPVSLTAQDFSDFDLVISGHAPSVVVNGVPTGALTLDGRTDNKRFNLTAVTSVLGPPQNLAAQVNFADAELPVTFETTLNNADLTPLLSIFAPDAVDLGVGVRASGSFRGSGKLFPGGEDADEETGKNPSFMDLALATMRGTANFSAFTLQAQELQMQGVAPVIINLTGNEIVFERVQFTGAGTNLSIGGTLARNDAGRENLALNGRFNLRLLNGFVPDSFFNGVADAAVAVTGSYAQPNIGGTAAVANGSFSRLIGNERLTLTGVRANAVFNQNQVELSRVEGILGGGRISGSGGVLLERFTPVRYRLAVRGNNVTLPLPEGFRSTTDGQIEVNGFRDNDGVNKRFITGSLNVKRAEYAQEIEVADFIARKPETTIATVADDATQFEENTNLDLRIAGRDALVVRNSQIDALGSLDIRITGTVAEPIYAGRIPATRAALDFLGKRYELTRGYIVLPGRLNAEPEINVQAEADIKSYRVTLRATGPLSQLRVELTSDPALPQADIVALITTGQLDPGFAGNSTLARSEVGSAATVAAEALVNAPVRRATDKLFGLNRFEIDPRISDRGVVNPTARLTLGKQINRNLSIIYSTNLASDQNQVVAVEYRLSNRLSLVAQYEQAPVTSLSSNHNIFSFEVRLKKRF
jgi:translocation and assembly module TamB